jgi:hypothetical protein
MERVFPAGCLTAEPHGDALPAELLVRATPGWRKLFGRRWQTPEIRFLRVLRSLQAGISAERRGIHERADFYFENAYNEFAQLGAGGRIWEGLSSRLGCTDARAVTARELFFQAHAGIIKGYLELNSSPMHRSRLLKHVIWAERALKFAGLTAQEEASARAWLSKFEIDALTRAGKHNESLAAFERSLGPSSPASFKDAYIETVYEFTTRQLNRSEPGGEAAGERDVNSEAFHAGVARFQGMFSSIADRPLAFERLAELSSCEITAVSSVSIPSLATFQRAVDADPFNLNTHNVDVQTRFALTDLQETVARVEAEAAAEQKVLNAEGLSLKSSVTNSIASVDAYIRSKEAALIQYARKTATARGIWSLLALPQNDSWEQRALDLVDAIGASLVSTDLNAPGFPAALAKEQSAKPSLAGLDVASIARRLLEVKGALPPIAEQADPPLPAIIVEAEALPVTEERLVPGGEDFADWLFSTYGLATRWALGVATVISLIAGSLTFYNAKVNAVREALFPRVMAAARESRYDTVVDLSARFLSGRPLSGRSHRDEIVEQAYAEALVNLFAQSPGQPSPSLIVAAQQYSRLVHEPKGGRP